MQPVYEVSLRSRARSSEPSSAVSTLENSLSNFKEYIVPAVPETTSESLPFKSSGGLLGCFDGRPKRKSSASRRPCPSSGAAPGATAPSHEGASAACSTRQLGPSSRPRPSGATTSVTISNSIAKDLVGHNARPPRERKVLHVFNGKVLGLGTPEHPLETLASRVESQAMRPSKEPCSARGALSRPQGGPAPRGSSAQVSCSSASFERNSSHSVSSDSGKPDPYTRTALRGALPPKKRNVEATSSKFIFEELPRFSSTSNDQGQPSQGSTGDMPVTHDDDYIQRGGVHWNEGDVRKESKIRMMVASPKFTGEGSLDFYKLGPVAGKGAFSTVYTAWHRLSGKRVAIKQYNLNRLARDTVLSTSVKREIKLLTKMNHPGIVHLYETFETRSVLCLVYEFIPNGTLFSALRKQRQGDVTAGPSTMTEAQVSRILLSLAQALQHMHSRNIMHRDMKLDNVMLLHDNKPKILDFGFGACCKRDVPPGTKGEPEEREANLALTQVFGTPMYMAPEVWDQWYAKAADVWSLGVIIYCLLEGHFPFWASTEEELKWSAKRGVYHHSESVSPAARNLLSRMLQVDPAKRLTAAQVYLDLFLCPQFPAFPHGRTRHL
ncbi:hypothetical protein CYMTET_56281 [Cymbomonas tetramitiformis]|uniref:Protein kinase domain-containing protein n=1 Tax=Cymbomonas tetramitiformis TaxID=36881 RepID=A0AAE0BCN5_9CHLO|nr:hypothetical protein CYMTET_56281 [Cymbomonas tetramitiformis]